MDKFQDVSIYLGSSEVMKSSRLEVAVKSPFLHTLISSLNMCDGCREPVVFIFPEGDQDPDPLRMIFRKKGFSIIQSKSNPLSIQT